MKKYDLNMEEILKSIDMLSASAVDAGGNPEAMDYSEYSGEELEQMGFTDAQQEEIRLGLRQLLPVQHYARTCYNWKQMREIRKGLYEYLNVSMYNNSLFTAEQMREIRKGLESNLEVSSYAHLMLSARDMQTARKALLKEDYHRNPTGHAKEGRDEGSGIWIRISEDCMQAFMTLPPNRMFRERELERILKEHDIVFGILGGQLKKAADGVCGTEEILVADGKRAADGADGRYEYFFERHHSEVPRVKENGSVDYAHLIMADKRSPGDVLARYYPAEEGTDGETVNGIAVNSKKGRELPLLQGHGITYDEEKHLYRADTTGYVVLDEEEGALNVWDVYVVEGDINRYNGNINYDGIIHIRGSVSDMAKIEASGNVVVEGYVEGACIKAGGDIILQSGMNGCGTGVLEAGGRVAGKFFEAANIYAKGDVEGDYFLNCKVETDRSLLAKQEKSRIVGGSIKAAYSVETSCIIGSGKLMTAIEVGNPIWLERKSKETQEKLAKTEDELRQLLEGREKVGGMLGGETQKQNLLFHKICVAIRMKEEEALKLKGEIRYHEQVKKRAKRAYIKVINSIQAGVLLSVCGKIRRVERDLSGMVTFRTEGV